MSDLIKLPDTYDPKVLENIINGISLRKLGIGGIDLITNVTGTLPVANGGTGFIIKPIARAYLGTNQLNITDVTPTKVLLDTENFDVDGNFANYKFVAPVAGYYQVNATVRIMNYAGHRNYYTEIWKNGAAVTDGENNSSAAYDNLSISISDIIYLAATDYLELYVNFVCDVNTVDISAGSNYTFMSIALIG